ncbi:MAG: hypothetical protein HYX40_06470 [Sphingobacteriales bacterium]|nr:hypothetical protein [Sphingobacteriales bacterium]
MKNTFFAFLIITALIISPSCKKKSDGTPSGPGTVQNFQPTTSGSTWTYTAVSNGTTRDYTLTATSKDTVINTTTYKVFTNSGGPNEYYTKTGSDYYHYSFYEAINQAIELLYIKDNLSVNNSWKQTKNATINGVNGTAELECVVMEKGISYTAGGKTYADVTHVKINPTFYASGFKLSNNKADIHYYFANNTGFIYSTTDLSVAIPFSSPYIYTGTVTLIVSNIK